MADHGTNHVWKALGITCKYAILIANTSVVPLLNLQISKFCNFACSGQILYLILRVTYDFRLYTTTGIFIVSEMLSVSNPNVVQFSIFIGIGIRMTAFNGVSHYILTF